MKKDRLLIANQSSQRLHYRKACLQDWDVWLPFFQDPKTSQHWKTEALDPVNSCQRWYDRQFYRYQNNLGGLCAMIDKSKQRLIGHCGLILHHLEGQALLEIGYHVLPQYWGQGYATEAAQCCRDYVFQHNIADELICIISVSNQASKNVAQKLGMTLDSKTTYADNEVELFKITQEIWLNCSSAQQ